ncbi:mitogen-activated protein kinase kinase kinase 1-like isoform X2 [Zootermopsis nevadensis]|nr:mitogen-activated protein kinase kinase kinase 1-like isoform X2 [Zootermopsis nevadensis]
MGLPELVEHSSQASNKTTALHLRCCRTPPPILGSGMGEGSHPRKRSPSIPRSRPSSPGSNSTRRPPSPGALDPAVLEAVKSRVRRVQQARLYLLQQTGPNSFLVGGDSPEHKYRVVIGPQTCSCGRGPHCLHLLFVMLRVFQVPESDSRIYAKELKNFEVESLFHNYQERRNLRVNVPPDDMRKDVLQPHCGSSRTTPQSESSSFSVTESVPASDVKPAEEELCPICLLEMVDGESLVVCITGCRNKLHHHCMAIWAEECYQQSERVLCPLCRHSWINEADTNKFRTHNVEELGSKRRVSTHHHQSTFHNLNNMDPPQTVHKITGLTSQQQKKSHHKAPESKRSCTPSPGLDSPLLSFSSGSSGYKSSSDSAQAFQGVLSHAGVIPSEQLHVASEWVKVFGADLVSCLYSRDWKAREMALRRLVNDIVASHYSESEEEQQQVLWHSIKILTMVAADPVFKVYLSCIRCFRVFLSYASCHSNRQVEELQELIRPIIRILLLKCTDQNRRTAHLSVEILVELAKGQNGELSLGKSVSDNSNCKGLEGLELVLGCVLEEWSFDTVSSQWLAGRLIILDRLIQDFPNEFWLQYVPLYPNESGYKLHNYNRLITVVEFSFKALRSPNSMVAKLARHVFVLSSSMTAKERGVFNQVLEMLSSLDPNLQTCLRKRLHQAASESGTRSQTAWQGSKKAKAAHCVVTERCHGQHESQHGRSTPLHTYKDNAVVKSLLSSSVLDAACQTDLEPGSGTSPPRPRDLPLDNSNVKNKKPVKFQHVPCISPIQIPSSKRWSGSGSKLLSLFTNKKHDELLPTKPELNGIYRDTSSPVGQVCENCLVGNCHRHVNPHHFFFGSLCSKVMTPTTPEAPHTTPILENHKCTGQAEEFLDDVSEELVIPLDLSNLKSQFDSEIPTIPGLNSPLVLDDSANHPHDKNMEGGVKCSSYLEGLNWKRGQLLGTGAFSSCYQARDVATGTLMAVKQVPFCRISADEQAIVELGIHEEIVTMSKLRHENIVRILGATKQGSHFNMFVEWMAGGSVAGMLERYGPFNEEVILRYTKQILEGLSYLHDNHILHRDLKGANLLVDSTGYHLRIGDFGTAARLVSQTTVPGEFQGQLLGTIAFMAPEVLRGEDYGRSCDVWSVGCCMIEMASTKPPWKENCMSNHLALMYKIASSKDPPSIPDTLSWALKDLALQCLLINSELRPTAKELLHHACFREWQT